jgi:hypothetical protein
MNKFKMAATALIASIVAALIVVLALLVYYVHES